jgi:nucleotidyltransferase/DNA polymerase involved in DNA repair
MTERKIIHIDMDAFYASVEQRDNPELRGKPVAVGHAEERGVVAAASYEARRFGVRSAMSSQKAKRLCPQLIFIPGRMDVYKSVSRQIHEIFHEYTDVIEPISLDEAFLDVTENKPGILLAVDIAREIKRKVRERLSLVASAGVSYNKFLAKIASDYRKPDGLCTIHPDQALDFIAHLPIESFWGVGPVTARKMHVLGIHTGGQLRACSQAMLLREFGRKEQKPERRLAITQSTYNAGQQIIEEGTGDAYKSYKQIIISSGGDIVRRTHHAQNICTTDACYHGKHHRHHRSQLQADRHITAHCNIIPRSELLCHRNAESSATSVAETEYQEYN